MSYINRNYDNKENMKAVKLKSLKDKKVFNKEMVYDIAHNNQEKKEIIQAYANINYDSDYLLAQSVIPTSRDTVLKQVVHNFQTNSNIPVLLTVQFVMSLLAGYLLEKQIYAIKDGVSKVYPDIWAVVLAPSGAVKTTSLRIIKDAFGFNPSISSGLESDAAYIEELTEKNFGMLVRDEFGQHLKEVQNGCGPMAKQRDYYLKTYDGENLERKTKKGTITVDKPKIVLLGMTVDETFYKIMTWESLTDGLAQRFNYTVANKDPEKKILDWLDLDETKLSYKLSTHFEEIKNLNLHEQYEITDLAKEIIQSHFKGLFSRYEAIPESFIRRLYWATFKYALVYHILLCKETPMLDDEDINCACNYMSIHVKSLKNLLDGIGFSDIEEDMRMIDNAVTKIRAAGKKVDINAIVRHLLRNHKTKYKEAEKTRKMVSCLYVLD